MITDKRNMKISTSVESFTKRSFFFFFNLNREESSRQYRGAGMAERMITDEEKGWKPVQ